MKHNEYYISTKTGNDRNDGKTPESALYSLKKLSHKKIRAGDKILLERGSVFEDDWLHLCNVNGTKEMPVVVDCYGKGELPRIETNGQGIWFQDYGCTLDNPLHKYRGYVSSAVLLYDCSYIELNHFAITNAKTKVDAIYNDLERMNRTGVAVVAQNAGTLNHIHIKNLDIRHVYGNVYDKHMNNGGIYFTAFLPTDEQKTGISRYHDILIDGCYLEDVNRWGIAAVYTAYANHFATKEIDDKLIAKYGSSNVIIRNNCVKDAGGDSITAMYCDRPLIEWNISEGAAKQINKTDYSQSDFGRVAAAIWPWKCKNALLQYNEAFHTRYHNGENQDGQAFDADWGDGTVYQYNYSHDNDGGCLMVCGEEAVNTVFRYNISQNDSRVVLMPASSPVAQVYHNTFYIKEGVPFIDTNSDSVGEMILKNNIVYSASKTPVCENWYPEQTKYENNLFYGYSNPPTKSGNNISADPKLADAGTGKTGTVGKPALDSLTGYQLQPDSPAIQAGCFVTDEVKKDFFENPLDTTVSIGVHQPKEKTNP